MKKMGNKLPVKSQMDNDEDDIRPAKKVMQAIGKSILAPKAKKKAPKVANGPSSQNSKKQNRTDVIEKSKDADEQE